MLQGIDKSTAQRILSIWRESGATSPEGLRKLFLKRSFTKSTRIGLQLLIDLAAGGGAYYAAKVRGGRGSGHPTLLSAAGSFYTSPLLEQDAPDRHQPASPSSGHPPRRTHLLSSSPLPCLILPSLPRATLQSITPNDFGSLALAGKYGLYFLAMYLLIGASFEFFR